MKKIKQPSVAGMFYTNDKDELSKQVESFKNNSKKDYNYKTRAVIVPHAGYEYSGQLAYEGIQYLSTEVKNVFIFAPAHRFRLDKTAVSGFDEWATPSGNIPVNQEINKILIDKFGSIYSDEAFAEEHSVEVQLPLLQKHLKNFTIIPVLIGSEQAGVIRDIINHFYSDKTNAFVVSSDLSHFHNTLEAKEIDKLTAEALESNNLEGFSYEQACGVIGIYALTAFAYDNNFALIRIGMHNSGEVTGEADRVVGYGSWLLFEGEKNQFIEQFFSDYIIEICKKSISYNFENNKKLSVNTLEYIPEVFNELGACFVTLEINNNLRGCIGSIIAHTSLIDDLVSNSYNAAFFDSRFNPLTKPEFNNIKIAVSLLSTPVKMDFINESDLISNIVPFEDGIIIKDGNHQAVYLPSVWEQLPDRVDFLTSLKVKAGLNPDHFSKNFEVYKFNAKYVKE